MSEERKGQGQQFTNYIHNYANLITNYQEEDHNYSQTARKLLIHCIYQDMFLGQRNIYFLFKKDCVEDEQQAYNSYMLAHHNSFSKYFY